MFLRFLDLNRCANIVFASALLIFFLPLFALYFVLSRFNARGSRLIGPQSVKTGPFSIDLLRRRLAAELTFDRAIDAYEELIDSTFAEERQ